MVGLGVYFIRVLCNSLDDPIISQHHGPQLHNFSGICIVNQLISSINILVNLYANCKSLILIVHVQKVFGLLFIKFLNVL